MDDMQMQVMLSKLNYSQHWLDSGVLTESILMEQIKELELGEDDNTEHYRYRTLNNYFKSKAYFDNNILQDILQLLEDDVDKSMAGSATILLLRIQALTDKQFKIVVDFLRTFGDWTTKYIDKAQEERIQDHLRPT